MAFILFYVDDLIGTFSWKSVLPVILIFLMGLIAVSFAVFVGYKAFRGKANKKDDV